MNQEQQLIDSRLRLQALPQSGDVKAVLHMVENNLAVIHGRRGVKAFDGAFVASEVERVCGYHGTQPVSEASGSAQSEALKGTSPYRSLP